MLDWGRNIARAICHTPITVANFEGGTVWFADCMPVTSFHYYDSKRKVLVLSSIL